MRLPLVLTLVVLATVNAARKSYDGFKVVKVIPEGKEQTDYLHDLQQNDVDIDFWQEIPRHGPVTIMVSLHKYVELSTEFLRRDIRFEVINENVEEQILEEHNRIMQRKAFNLHDFNTLQDIESELSRWVGQCRGGVSCSRYPIGDNTYYGRTIYVFSMSSGSGRPAAWLDATVHAREWLSTATILKLMDWFITGYGIDNDATSILNTYDLYFVAVANPDGYVETHLGDRLWRKNRSPITGSSCVGVDLNRNFDFRWGEEGADHNPCSQTYGGSHGHSEVETRAMAEEITRINVLQTVVALVTINSFAEMWLFPWGNTVLHLGQTCERAANHDQMLEVARIAATASGNTYGTSWDSGNSCDRLLYPTTGTSIDWAKGEPRVAYPYDVETRGNGFVVPPNQIDPSFQEVRNGLVAMFAAIAEQESK